MTVSKFNQFLDEIAKDIQFEEGASGIKKILVSIYRSGKSSIKILARKTKIPQPTISLILQRLEKAGLLFKGDDGAKYTVEGMKYVESNLGFRSLETMNCRCCHGSGIETNISGRHERLFTRLQEICTLRPKADVTLDQSNCTCRTLLKRLILMHQYQVFDGNSILFLGDDDFVSISCMLPEFIEEFFVTIRSNEDPPFRITVMDVDDRILQKIREITDKTNMNKIKIVRHDLRKPVPLRLRNRFDVVFTDPPYTLEGVRLFLARAIVCLKKKPGSRIFLSVGHLKPSMMHTI
ncbi:MAG: bis-aminopropyl spermidine synthase family protein, partial [Promethearchaeota archaeon]